MMFKDASQAKAWSENSAKAQKKIEASLAKFQHYADTSLDEVLTMALRMNTSLGGYLDFELINKMVREKFDNINT